ncbi:MAG: DUF2129 domain-containing protein [Turicibacter sp.]
MNQSRVQVIVYSRKSNISQKLSQFGHVIYASKKMHYVCLYINEAQKDSIVSKIKNLHGVQKVEVSLHALPPVVEK